MPRFKLNTRQKRRLQGMGVLSVYLFGSRAQGVEHALSDYDYAVLMKEGGHQKGDIVYFALYDILSEISPRSLEMARFFLTRILCGVLILRRKRHCFIVTTVPFWTASIAQFWRPCDYLVQHHLRLALEGIFHISSHILSRIPGNRAVEYKEIARKMGEAKIVPREFAERALVPMAGMRNMLVHQYSDLDAARLHDIIKNHRVDIEAFLSHIGNFLKNPKPFGLTVK